MEAFQYIKIKAEQTPHCIYSANDLPEPLARYMASQTSCISWGIGIYIRFIHAASKQKC
jgi:hypothetical protein